MEKVSFDDIIRTMEPRWVMASMATAAVGILTFLA
jgi:hypothetical protein